LIYGNNNKVIYQINKKIKTKHYLMLIKDISLFKIKLIMGIY